MKKMMKPEEIPDFVSDVVATGCDITAIGDDAYVLGDADLPEPQCFEVQPELKRIGEHYGSRDHLRHEIARYLHSIGRSYPPPVAH